MNTIQVELPQLEAISKQLADILALLQTAGTPYPAQVTSKLNEAAEANQEAPEQPQTGTQENTQPEPEKPAEAKEQAKVVTLGDVKQLATKLSASSAGMKAQVRQIVKGYADRVYNIPEDKLAEAYERMKALEG